MSCHCRSLQDGNRIAPCNDVTAGFVRVRDEARPGKRCGSGAGRRAAGFERGATAACDYGDCQSGGHDCLRDRWVNGFPDSPAAVVATAQTVAPLSKSKPKDFIEEN